MSIQIWLSQQKYLFDSTKYFVEHITTKLYHQTTKNFVVSTKYSSSLRKINKNT